MELIIVTGISGAGKSSTVAALEDIGFYCVDNMPPLLLTKFAEICAQADGSISRIAIVVDMRSREFFKSLANSLEELKKQNFSYKLLFLDASNSVLARRYKETRRKHPLIDESDSSVENAINRERELLRYTRNHADYIVDTTHITSTQLKERINKIFLESLKTGMLITCISFGSKYGSCTEADLVFDVRCLPNPFYVNELKQKTGLEKEVVDYVYSFSQAVQLKDKINDLVDFLIPQYLQEGKSQLTIGFGCTGGKHRSVVFAQAMYEHLTLKENRVTVVHRDIKKE